MGIYPRFLDIVPRSVKCTYCKTERTVDNKINEKAISKRIFEKIYNEAVETNDMMDNLLFCYKKATNIMTACYRFDQYLKQNNFDQSVTVW